MTLYSVAVGWEYNDACCHAIVSTDDPSRAERYAEILRINEYVDYVNGTDVAYCHECDKAGVGTDTITCPECEETLISLDQVWAGADVADPDDIDEDEEIVFIDKLDLDELEREAYEELNALDS